jgi:pimeloyl-ACP methyl ester carboxylesterase
VFYRRHPKADELPPDPAPIPLLVFIHGLGGSVAQFHPLLLSLSNNASCLAVDLPGCGRSEFAPTNWEAYTTDALVDLLELIIDEYRDKAHDQGVILIGHSMGTVLAARLANKQAPNTMVIASHVLGVVGICPVSGPPSEAQAAMFRKLLWIPTWLFNLWRWWDQRGGPQSASVSRFVGPEADMLSRQLQDRYNKQSRTPVFRRMAWGSLPTYVDGKPTGGLFGEATWAGLNVPVFLIGGEKDTVTSPREVDKIAKLLESDRASAATNGTSLSQTIPDSAAPVSTTSKPSAHLPESIKAISDKHFARKDMLTNMEESFEDPSTPRDPVGFPTNVSNF